MGLVEVQRALARLYTDEELRQRFFDDPAKVGVELQLSDRESAELQAMEDLPYFAQTLVKKRALVASHLLRRTARCLGSQFGALFQRYAPSYRPRGVRKHQGDAIQFASWLSENCQDPVWVREVARYESGWLEMWKADASLLVRSFSFHVDRIGQTGKPTGGPMMGLWIRPPGLEARFVGFRQPW